MGRENLRTESKTMPSVATVATMGIASAYLLLSEQPTSEHISTDSIVKFIVWFHQSFPAVGTLFLLMMLDVLLGIGAAVVTKSLSSNVSREGMIRKVMTLLLLGVCAAVERHVNGIPIAAPAAMLFIYTELISILEKAGKSGLPIPKQLIATLAALNKAQTPASSQSADITEQRKT